MSRIDHFTAKPWTAKHEQLGGPRPQTLRGCSKVGLEVEDSSLSECLYRSLVVAQLHQRRRQTIDAQRPRTER